MFAIMLVLKFFNYEIIYLRKQKEALLYVFPLGETMRYIVSQRFKNKNKKEVYVF